MPSVLADQVPMVRTRRYHWWLLAAAWAVAAAALMLWLRRTPIDTLRDQLRHRQFWWLEIQFLLVLSLSCLNVPVLVRALGLRARDFGIPVAAAALAFALATWAAPKTNRIYYD